MTILPLSRIELPVDVAQHFNRLDVREIVTEYLGTALWSTTDDEGDPMDGEYDAEDFTLSAWKTAVSDVTQFLDSAVKDGLAEVLLSLGNSSIGHNLWLTANRHGAGFWDLGLGEDGDVLSRDSHNIGSRDLYIDDAGTVQLS